ncbi:MAG: hypothetical protein JRD03_03390 [Deltaproteobacteria bacterium]|nr:hypothetical protein [Deltaproteobacteria bacterium]
MNGRCKQIQDILAELGATAFQDDESAQLHLADCEHCYAVLTAINELDSALPALPIHDASDECVDGLLARVRDLPLSEPAANTAFSALGQRLRTAAERASQWHARLAASAVAVAAVSAAGVAIVVSMVDLNTSMPELAVQPAAELDFFVRPEKKGSAYGSLNEFEYEAKKRSMKPSSERQPAQQAPAPALALRSLGYIDDGGRRNAGRDSDQKFRPDAQIFADANSPIAMEIAESGIEQIIVSADKTSPLGEVPTSSTGFSAGDLQRLRIADVANLGNYTPSLEIDSAFEAKSKSQNDESPSSMGENALAAAPPPKTRSLDELVKRVKSGWKEESADPKNREAAFGVRGFQDASGYWSNAYVPGDPAIRLLETRLNATDREMLQAYAAAPLQLHNRAHPVRQPFDAPTEAAMQIFLHSDRTALEGAERLTLQVGLQGARRQGGTRPPMNIGVVLDLRGAISAENATQMRAVVDALRMAKEVGDQFSLRFAGRACTGVDSNRFEYGPLSVAVESCFGADPGAAQGVAIAAALESAAQAVHAGDDPDAPLGSSMVLLVTSQSIAGDLAALEAIGHESAVAGVPISVAGIGAGVSLDEIDRLTLAGQGNRRLVTTPDEAREAVDRELSALSRAVARALRLRIRLAPGVKLIRILDASRLDEEGADRVREAEQSIDLRMASELGIEVDRGEDEHGIQIVIPSFYAGGSHAILLDVVAPEAGPIADVTLRYKDLIYQRNGVVRANLNLGAESRPTGPLERNVLKNVLTVRMSSALTSAGRALSKGHVDDAANTLGEQRERLLAFRTSDPASQSDAELAADLELLDEYLSLLGSGAADARGTRQYLANSLQLAGHFKTLPRTRADKSDPREAR